MNKFCLAILTFTFSFYIGTAQNVGIGTSNPDRSAILEVNSTSGGLLPPRMTFTQRNAIQNPASGLIIFCTDCGTNGAGEMNYFNGVTWMNMSSGIASNTIDNLQSVTIGSKIWSTKNLDVAKYRNGDPIPNVTDPNQWANLTTGAWCWYNNDSANYAATYGRLYNWYAVNDPRGLAPMGWHVPDETEWNKMVKYIDNGADTLCQDCTQSTTAGGAMKRVTGWYSPNTGASNSSGFSALPGGGRSETGAFYAIGEIGGWWSAIRNEETVAWVHALYNYSSHISRLAYNNFFKVIGFSVRVVMD